ncbi:MAG: hypothetical protein IPL65_00520 [Lewinellaceae bacterium]|nr:hypothetical protein [Lewinellaceae bacterium]
MNWYTGKREQCEPLYLEARAIYTEGVGKKHPNTLIA